MQHARTPRATRTLAGLGAGLVAAAGLALVATPSADAAAVTQVVPSHTMSFGDTRATGHNDFLDAGGVRVWTEGSTSTDKAAAYFDADQPLADAATGEPTLAWTAAATEGANAGNLRPGMQLVTDFDGDGSVDGILVGEPTYADGTALYGEVWWLSNSSKQFVKDAAPATGGGYGSAFHGTLDQWSAAFADARAVYGGWSLGSGVKGDGVVSRLTIGETAYTFSKSPAPTTTTLYRTDVDTSETRATGHNDFREEGGVRVWTEGATSTDKAAGYFAVGTPLATAGEPALAWSGEGGRPGLQLRIDADANGTVDGTLVGEPVYGNDWWLTGSSSQLMKDAAPSTAGGYGSGFHGVLAQWRTAFPDAVITTAGWSLGSGVKGDGVISSITIGLRQLEFSGVNRAPVAAPSPAAGVPGLATTVLLQATDPDGDALTYTTPAGTVQGDRLVVPVPRTATQGTYRVPFTVSDGKATSSSTVVLRVTKAPTRVQLSTTPQRITTADKRVVLRAALTSTGATSGKVFFFDRGRRIGSAQVKPNGVAVLRTGPLARGKHTIRAAYFGNGSSAGAQDTVRKQVRRG